MNKMIGYIIGGIGVLAVIIDTPQIKSALKLSFLENLPSMSLSIGGLVLLVIGGIILSKTSSGKKQEEEVPIYEGEGKHRRIVGYRKMSSK